MSQKYTYGDLITAKLHLESERLCKLKNLETNKYKPFYLTPEELLIPFTRCYYLCG